MLLLLLYAEVTQQVGSFEVMDTCGNMVAIVPRWSNPDASRCGRVGSTIAGQSVLSSYSPVVCVGNVVRHLKLHIWFECSSMKSRFTMYVQRIFDTDSNRSFSMLHLSIEGTCN